jgi:hypothetical protein
VVDRMCGTGVVLVVWSFGWVVVFGWWIVSGCNEAVGMVGCGRYTTTRWFVPGGCGLEESWRLSTYFLGVDR